MRVLFVGDVVGPAAVAYLADRLPVLRADLALDVVIANAENCGPTGIGMAVDLVERLVAAGVDVVTAGNHAFDGPEVAGVLAVPRVLRPLNLSPGVLGRGSITIDVGGEALTCWSWPIARHWRSPRPWRHSAGGRGMPGAPPSALAP